MNPKVRMSNLITTARAQFQLARPADLTIVKDCLKALQEIVLDLPDDIVPLSERTSKVPQVSIREDSIDVLVNNLPSLSLEDLQMMELIDPKPTYQYVVVADFLSKHRKSTVSDAIRSILNLQKLGIINYEMVEV